MAHLRAHRLYRSLACLLLTSLLLALPMLAAATSLADDLSALSDDELLLLKQLIDAEVEARGLVSAAGAVQASDEPLVWIPKSGSKYHATSTWVARRSEGTGLTSLMTSESCIMAEGYLHSR